MQRSSQEIRGLNARKVIELRSMMLFFYFSEHCFSWFFTLKLELPVLFESPTC